MLAIREFQNKPVPPEIVRRIVEDGRLTESSMNRQPWHFIVVQNRDSLRQLGALAKTGPTSRRQRWPCRGDSKDAVLGFGWKPRDSNDDVDGVVGRSGVELGWLYGIGGGQTSAHYFG